MTRVQDVYPDNKVMLPGSTKEGLKMLPEFKYATG